MAGVPEPRRDDAMPWIGVTDGRGPMLRSDRATGLPCESPPAQTFGKSLPVITIGHTVTWSLTQSARHRRDREIRADQSGGLDPTGRTATGLDLR